jgi:hypothetical protein
MIVQADMAFYLFYASTLHQSRYNQLIGEGCTDITLHYITLHYITLHYITLHYITLHYITLHYITLHLEKERNP